MAEWAQFKRKIYLSTLRFLWAGTVGLWHSPAALQTLQMMHMLRTLHLIMSRQSRFISQAKAKVFEAVPSTLQNCLLPSDFFRSWLHPTLETVAAQHESAAGEHAALILAGTTQPQKSGIEGEKGKKGRKDSGQPQQLATLVPWIVSCLDFCQTSKHLQSARTNVAFSLSCLINPPSKNTAGTSGF